MKLYTDGGSRGNPGNSGIGYLLFDNNDRLVDFGAEYIGKQTNNYAEYFALLRGVSMFLKSDYSNEDCSCFLDSELVVRQLNGEYKVKNENMIELFNEIKSITDKFKNITFSHIKRSQNRFADRLVNLVLDTKMNNIPQ